MKFLGRFFAILVDVILICFIVFAFIIRTSPVQTYLANQATAFLSRELGTELRIDEVAIVFFDRVALKGVYVEDEKGAVLADIKTLHVRLEALDLVKNKLTIAAVELDQGKVNLNRDSLTGDYNYWFLQDYFAGSSSSTSTKPMAIDLVDLKLTNVHFRYDDYRKSYSEFGMDWDHLDFENVNLHANNITIRGNDISCDVKNLSTKEKSGFVLSQLTTKALVVKKGIYLNDLSILTPESDVKMSRMHLIMHQLPDIYTFEDSVTFDARILPSTVSTKDISYFASALEGMEEIVKLSGNVSHKTKNLRITDLDLRVGQKSVIKGTLNLPNFDKVDQSFFSEKLTYAYVDLGDIKNIKMPKDQGGGYLSFDKYVERLGYFEGENVKLAGFTREFVISANSVKTELGTVRMDNGILFTENKANNSYIFKQSMASEYDVKIENFQLAKFLDDETFGLVDGTFFLSGEAFSTSNIRFDNIEGNVNRFDFMDYAYKNISITEGSIDNNVLTAKIDIKDDNLNLVYDGFIDLKGEQHMSFKVDIAKAVLDNLGLNTVNSKLVTEFSVDVYGYNEKNLTGNINLTGLAYTEAGKTYRLPEAMNIGVTRGEMSDRLAITSNLGNAIIDGKIDFSQIANSFQDQLSQILPAIFDAPPKRSLNKSAKNNFSYDITVKDMDSLFAVFVPGLHIKSGTKVSGEYKEATSDFSLKLTSSYISYDDFVFRNVKADQSAIEKNLKMNLTIGQFNLNDTISVEDVLFNATGSKDTFQSVLSWNPNTMNYSEVNWQSRIIDAESFDIEIQPSQIAIQRKQWDFKKSSLVEYRKEYISVKDFLFERQDQFISLEGKVSDDDKDKLKIRVSHLQLDDFAPIIQSPVELRGEANGFGELWTPFTNIGYQGDASIKGLFISNEEIGDVFVQSQWEKGKKSIEMSGDLIYKNTQTFQFDGLYNLDKKTDILEFNLVFDKMDLQFTNAFMDPQVVSDIEGTLDGKIRVTGTPDKPLLEGAVQMDGATAKIGILGVKYNLEGEIYCDEYGFYMDNIPVYDEEGNAGSLVGSIYHNNFSDWNFDLSFNLEDDAIHKDPVRPWKVLPLDRFLVMNTQYSEGDYYYGKAYMTGYANIFGYTDHLEITVDAKTRKGTYINFPMYGAGEISDEENFIQFKPADSMIMLTNPEIDFTGVDLNLNFDVTPDAKMKIIFNEKLGDEISADGSGRMSMHVNNLGDIALDGTYTINQGIYNFAMGPIKQNFGIEQGGYITWTGDPYNANLNIKSVFTVKANLAEISTDQLSSNSSSNQDVNCYLDITESLMSPTIGFDIEVPRADESGKALINRIKSDQEELNRQFFSLLLWKRFQPLKGSNTGTSGTALDLAANQINSMLSQLSQSYKLAVNLDADATGDKTYEVGVSKEFLDNRLILSGSFGVENTAQTTSSSTQSSLIGDVNLEYLLNEEGTFRVNIFNESNQNSVIQDNNQGLFKQGVGLHYQEDFTGYKNFKLIQYFLDLFRKSDNKRFPIKKKKSQTPVPKEESTPVVQAILTDEPILMKQIIAFWS